MANKVVPKISKPGSDKFPQKGPHNPNVGTSERGIAPKPSGGAAMQGNDRPSAPGQASLARVKNAGNSKSAGSFLPVRKPSAGLANQRVGQTEAPPPGAVSRIAAKTSTPVTANALATQKPTRRKTPAPFYGEF